MSEDLTDAGDSVEEHEVEVDVVVSEPDAVVEVQDSRVDDAEKLPSEAQVEDCMHHAFMAKVTEVEINHFESSTASCVNCDDLNSKIVKLRSHNFDLVTELTNLKEAYDVLNKSEKDFKDTIS